MLIFDQLKKDDPQLRALSFAVLTGLLILLAGLWWVQVVSAREYQAHLETQAYRTVRIPAPRGKILDRNGTVLAENRPSYNISLYLEELRVPFESAYLKQLSLLRAERKAEATKREHDLHRSLTKAERRQFLITSKDKATLREIGRDAVASNLVAQIGQRVQVPLTLDITNFERHYQTRLALPYPVLTNLDATKLARFEEQSGGLLGADLEVQSTRVYPFQTLAGHTLGYLQRDDSSEEGEESFFSYRLPDYKGVLGVEGGYDKELRGAAGSKSVLVNSIGYRQTENIWSPAEPGKNVILTIDARIQAASEKALQEVFGQNTSGAVVVMDVETGDMLTLASSPTINPNDAIHGYPNGTWQRWQDPDLRPLRNRATQENLHPGSVFKAVVGMAALEAGLNEHEIYTAGPNPADPSKAMFFVGRHGIRDTAPPGNYDFRRAFKKSSNCYFIHSGLKTGIENIIRMGELLHFGERTGLLTRQETYGNFPTLDDVRKHWQDGDTANTCIGQGVLDVTPLQVAVMTAAIANGGKVLRPRLVQKIVAQDPGSADLPITFPVEVRDNLGLHPHTLAVLRDAMLADVEDSDGTGRSAAVPGMRIAGKTGTAQKKNQQGVLEEHMLWFTSYAPYDHPKYAVVIMVEAEHGGSGGITCAPVAHKIYSAIQECERAGAVGRATLARVER